MIRKKDEAKTEIMEKLKGGNGTIKFSHMVERGESFGKLDLCAVMELEPGASVGEHPHKPEAELYYVLEGEITVTNDGVPKVLKPGDAAFTGNGEKHSAANRTDRPAKMLAVVMN